MLRGYQMIDADGHVIEPVDLWETRLEPELRALVSPPQPGDTSSIYRDKAMPIDASLHLIDMRRQVELHYKEFLDAGWGPESQLKAMDEMGIDMAFLYPTSGLGKWSEEGMVPGLAAALARAYNEWLYEFSSYEPKRLMPVAGIGLNDSESSVQQLHRTVNDLGIRAVVLPPTPSNARLSDPAYKSFWAECERLGVSVGIHGSSYTPVAHTGQDRFNTRFALQWCADFHLRREFPK